MTVSQNYYKLYLDSIMELANTITIKSEYTAIAINNRITELYNLVPDPINLSSWKYYLNLAGRYHPTDTVIEITSLDDLTKITFDAQTLIDHPATKEAYKFGTRYFRELITAYPDMQQFIINCVYPVDIDKAIAAQDGEILSYPINLIEEQELSLIENIQKWLYNFKLRWYNKQFNVSDNLYCATNLGIMYLNLIPLILNLRLKACKTNEAHSFHIRNYLASHGYLDKYIEHLNLKQKLFLYRNIAYIERNPGKVSTFNTLVNKLLTERRLPLAEYSMRHDTQSLEDTYYSTPVFRKKELTKVYSNSNTTESVIDLDELLRREEPLAPGNTKFNIDYRDSIYNKFKNSDSSIVGTKVLESSVVDYTDSEAYALSEVRLGHWLKLASDNRYNSYITFKDPVTSVEKSLNVFDAFIFWFYCYCASMGIALVEIPKLFAYKTTRYPKPTNEQLSKLVNKNKISDDEINYLLDTCTTIDSNYSSINSFSNLVKNVYNNYKKQRKILSAEETSVKRGMLEAVAGYLYKDELIDTVSIINNRDNNTITTFSEWFASKAISTNNYTVEMFNNLHLDVFYSATGGDFYTTKDLGALQKAMVSILKQLSSYSIQIITQINAKNIRKVNWAAIRPDNIKDKEFAQHDVLAITTTIKSSTSSENSKIKIEPIPIVLRSIEHVSVDKIRCEIPVKFTPSKSMVIRNHVVRLGTMVLNHSFLNPTTIGGIKNLSAYDSFDLLTDEQKWSIKDVYFDTFKTDGSINKLLTSLTIVKNYLPGFNNLTINKPILKSFNITLFPTETYNRIRLLVNESLGIMLPNLGSIDVNAYSLYASNTFLSGFKFFAKKINLDAFNLTAGTIIAKVSYISDKMEFGIQLPCFKFTSDDAEISVFKYSPDERSVDCLKYSTDEKSLDFIKDIMSRATTRHPTETGSLVDGFYLVNQLGTTDYDIVGFSYNGDQINWS